MALPPSPSNVLGSTNEPPIGGLNPNPPKDTDGRREGSGKGVGEGATGEMAWALGVDGRSADGLQSPHRPPKAAAQAP